MTATSRPPPGKRRWHRATNAHTSAAPAHGIVLVSGATGVNGQVVLQVTRPSDDQDAMTGVIAHVWRGGIPASGYGYVSMDWPAQCLYDTAGTPAHGELWGPQADSFLLKRGNDGFMVLGDPLESPDRIQVVPGFHRPLLVRFELDSDLATTDATATVTVLTSYSGLTSGVTQPTTISNLAAASNYEFSGATDDTGEAEYDWETGEYTITWMECDDP